MEDNGKETQAAQGPRVNVVTGAFGFTGRYIASMLLARGETVRSLTNNPGPGRDDRIETFPMDFQDQGGLARAMDGASVLFNTYWIRFARGELDFERAVENSRELVEAARRAGVGKIVHISITNASEDSPYPYFRGKALVERAVRESGISHAIVRPALVFGSGDVLLNNIAWLLRKMPVFAVPGSGNYRVRPVFAPDMAGLAVDLSDTPGDVTADAAGPETITFNEVITLTRKATKSRAAVVHAPPGAMLLMSKAMGAMLQDVVITRDEIGGLRDELLVSRGPVTGETALSEWLERPEIRRTLGIKYASELDRHYRRQRGNGKTGQER